MERTVRDALLTALENLGETSFKKFRNKLTDCELEPGYTKIPKGRLEKAEPDEVVNLVLNRYTESYGPELTLLVLKAIGEKQEAENLEDDLKAVKGFSWRQKPNGSQPTSEASSSAAPNPEVETFVDKHRKALIDRCGLVAPILDDLFSKKLLTHEQYVTVKEERPSQNQMRKLYVFMKEWPLSGKQTLYEILKENNPRLVEDLEQS